MGDAPSQNYCSTHKNGLSSLTGCITWTCGESERMRAVMVVRWSSNHGDPPDDQNDLQFIKILSKSYVWCCNIKTATDDCQIWNARSPKKWKSMPKIVIYGIYDTTWNLKSVSKEEFQSSAFPPDRLSEDYRNIHAGLFDESCQIENFPSIQWSPKPPVQSSKMICYL